MVRDLADTWNIDKKYNVAISGPLTCPFSHSPHPFYHQLTPFVTPRFAPQKLKTTQIGYSDHKISQLPHSMCSLNHFSCHLSTSGCSRNVSQLSLPTCLGHEVHLFGALLPCQTDVPDQCYLQQNPQYHYVPSLNGRMEFQEVSLLAGPTHRNTLMPELRGPWLTLSISDSTICLLGSRSHENKASKFWRASTAALHSFPISKSCICMSFHNCLHLNIFKKALQNAKNGDKHHLILALSCSFSLLLPLWNTYFLLLLPDLVCVHVLIDRLVFHHITLLYKNNRFLWQIVNLFEMMMSFFGWVAGP